MESGDETVTSEEENPELDMNEAIIDDLFISQDDELSGEELIPISIDELVISQHTDPFCIDVHYRLNGWDILPFTLDSSGVVTRIVDRYPQMVIPETLKSRSMHITHHSELSGHPGGRKMYYILRRDYYWPALALDCYNTVLHCVS